jgi:hypothetical protein
MDITKNTYYTLQKINNFKTSPLYSMFKLYNPLHINLNNSEIMCTLTYCEKYNNFIINSLNIVNKPYNKLNNKNIKNNGIGMNKRIINNIHNSVEF